MAGSVSFPVINKDTFQWAMGGGIKIKSRQRFLLQALAIHFDSSPFTMGIAIEGAGAFGIRFPLSRHILIEDLL